MNKILLSFDEGTAIRQRNIITRDIIPFINSEILPLWEDLTIGELTKPMFEDLLTGGGTTAKKYDRSIESQLTSAGIKSVKLRENMKADTIQVLEGIQQAVSRLQTIYGREILNHVSFSKGKAVLTDAGLEAIEEKHRLYVETEKGKELRQLHLEAVSHVNKLLEAIQAKERLSDIRFFGQLFATDGAGGKVSIKPATLNYDSLV